MVEKKIGWLFFVGIIKNTNQARCVIVYIVKALEADIVFDVILECIIFFEQDAISPEALKQMEDRFTSIENGLKTADMLPIINTDALQYFREQKSKFAYFPGYEEVEQRELNSTIALLELLENFANEQGIPFEFVTISANQFNTGFNKKDFKEINVYFPNLNNVSFLKDAINLFDAEQPRSNFFYLYAKMENRDYQVISNLVKRLIRFAMDNYQR